MRNITHESTYNGLPLYSYSKNTEGFYKEILKPMEALMRDMVRKHNQVFFVRFDLHYPANSRSIYLNDNELLRKFTEALARRYDNNGYDPKYLWARELSPETGQFHYHVMLLLDSDHIQNAHGIKDYATKLWQKQLNIEDARGLVQLCKPDEHNENRYGGGVKIRRKDPQFPQVFGECFQWASYLAKVYSKGESPPNVNGFGCSRLS